MHAIGYRLRGCEPAEAEALFEALLTWQRQRIHEIRHLTDWLDDIAHTMPGMPWPPAPSELDDEKGTAPGDPDAAKGEAL